MPVVAVIPAIFAGAQIATVGIAAMSALQVVAAVGAIAAGVGAVTGNKALMKIGAVAGLVGGVGSFAQSQGWLSGAAGADAGALAGAEAAGSDYGAASAAEAGAIDSALAAQAPGVVDPSAALAGSVDPSAANYTNAMDMASDAASAGSGAAGAAAEAAGGLMNSGGPTGSGLNSVNGSDLMSDLYKGSGAGGFGAATSTSSSIFDTIGKAGDFMSKNKDLTSMGLKFVGGLFDEKAEAEGDYLKSGIELNMARTAGINTQTDIMKQQAANGNAVPDMTGLKVKPGSVYNTAPPPVYMAPRAGLINSTGR